MKQTLLLLLVAAVALTLVTGATAQAQQRNVTFIINTATVPDTLKAGASISITGAANDTSNHALTGWGTGALLTNIGGDYWSTTLQFKQGDTINYKIRVYPTAQSSGWEENINGPLNNTNRNFFIPTKDTVLEPQFWNSGNFPQGKNIGVFDKPYTAAADTFLSVYVRVNLKGVIDGGSYGYTAADKDSVCIMGDGKGGPDLDWGTPFYLTQEKPPTNSSTAFGMPANTFYSGRIRFRKSQVTAGTDVAYKFRLGSNWNYGSLQRSEQLSDPPYAGGNRHFKIPVGLKDTTLQWVYFGDAQPIVRANPDTCVITWNVNLSSAISKGGYTPGDTVEVQSGFFNTAVVNGKITYLHQVIGSLYTGKDTIVTKIGSPLDYQYYTHKFGQDNRENYYNFSYNGPQASEAERRQFAVPSKSFTITDTSNSIVSARRQPVFPNTRVLARKVHVTYTVDLRSAYYTLKAGDTLFAIQGPTTVYPTQKDSIWNWGVWINGPAVDTWLGWGNASGQLGQDPARKMWDDGTHGDKVAHDSIYSVVVDYSPDSVGTGSKGVVGQTFKFGISGSDNEGGRGGYGNNHAENIVDTDTTYTIASDYGSINPAYYNAWNFDLHRPQTPTGVVQLPGVAATFRLEQNYPNPFNPSTRIEFSIPAAAQVELKVFNILGQEVATLVNESLKAGNHEVTFDARRLATGVYIYRITAGTNVSTKKMLLLK